MAYLFITLAGLLGLCFGSFLSVIVFRLDKKEGILTGRSQCTKCLMKLKWHDLIPLLSFLTLGGKCRNCKSRISIVYPVMELSVAGALVLYFLVNGPYLNVSIFYHLIIIFLLLALVFFDYIYFILPDKVVFTGILTSLAYLIFYNTGYFLNSFLTGLALALFFGIIYLISRGEWIGFGDVKLSFLVGLVLGFPMALFSILFSVWIGAIVGLVLMAIGKADLKTPLPFGSFLGVLTVLFIIFSNYAQRFLDFF